MRMGVRVCAFVYYIALYGYQNEIFLAHHWFIISHICVKMTGLSCLCVCMSQRGRYIYIEGGGMVLNGGLHSNTYVKPKKALSHLIFATIVSSFLPFLVSHSITQFIEHHLTSQKSYVEYHYGGTSIILCL